MVTAFLRDGYSLRRDRRFNLIVFSILGVQSVKETCRKIVKTAASAFFLFQRWIPFSLLK